MDLRKTNKALRYLSDTCDIGYTLPSGNPDAGKAADFMSQEFPTLRASFRANVQFAGGHFYRAFERGINKLREAKVASPLYRNGTLIMGTHESEFWTVFYNMEAKPAAVAWDITGTGVFFSSKRSAPSDPELYCFFKTKGNDTASYLSDRMLSQGKSIDKIIWDLLWLLLYIEHASVEKITLRSPSEARGGHRQSGGADNFQIESLYSRWSSDFPRMG